METNDLRRKENGTNLITFSNLRIKSFASGVKYSGRFNFPRKILSIVFLLSSPVNGGWKHDTYYAAHLRYQIQS